MKIAVIGGAGLMGSWLVHYFSSKGHEVIVSDINLNKASALAEETGISIASNNIEASKYVDVVLISTPLRIAADVVKEITPYMQKRTMIVEISSIKSNVVKALIEASKHDLHPLSIHPLFGPGTRELKGRKVAVIPLINLEAEIKMTERLFPEAEIVVAEAEEHDQAMAVILSIPRFINVVFAKIIGEECLTTLKKLEGTTFKLQRTLAESIMFEDNDLHATIQMYNEYSPQFISKFLSEAKILESLIVNKEEKAFTELCDSIKKNLLSQDIDFTKAYNEMYKILDNL